MVEKIGNSTRATSIQKISFHIMPPELIKKMSVANINTKMLYDIQTRKPNPGGALDLRLGVSTKTALCQTCNESIQSCPGHYGHIDLVLPVFHIGLIKPVMNILSSVCTECGSLLLPLHRKLFYLKLLSNMSDEANANNIASANKNNTNDNNTNDNAGFASSTSRSNAVESIRNECKKAKNCPQCKAATGVIKKNQGFRIYSEIKSKDANIVELNPQTVLNIFEMIEEDDYPYLGIKLSPCSFIITVLPVPPSCIRPSVDMMDQGFNEDDLTVKFSEIINTNSLLEESIRKGNSLVLINEDWDMLQLQVSLLINSDLPGIHVANAPSIRGVVQRLKGKGGRFRCNLSGKRVDFSGRTVISPDPNLSVEQVGIPERIAKILTVPEKVTHFNRPWLLDLVKNGTNYPGANFVISKDNKGNEIKKYLMYAKIKELKIGDTVERHLLNNDVLLFNRQPSLHRMSIMAHKAKIHQNRTFRFNECVCSPYNADFDGDEMNIHLPQTYEARAEALELMGIRNNICTPRNNEPLISCTQDFLTGSYLLTCKKIFFTRERFAQLCSYAVATGLKIEIQPAILKPVELFTGKQLYEVIINHAVINTSSNNSINNNASNNNSNNNNSNNYINLNAKNKSYRNDSHMNEGYVLIKNNRFIKGRLDKAIIGGENRKGSLIYQLLKISRSCAVAAMNSIARASSRYLAETGFSIGLDDVFPSDNLIAEKNKIVHAEYKTVAEIIEKNDAFNTGGAFRVNPDLEMEISSTLNKIREECGNVCISNLPVRNSPVVMQECGSKGSKINVSQMIACVGQQIISGKRIPEGMLNRTLPHFDKNSLTPESRGFVVNSFFTGMSGYEFFFHAVSGREGLVDTAVKTAETGYMQRRLMKALEDLSIKYDYTVRNSFNDLVQLRYGEDNAQTLKNEDEEFLPWLFEGVKSIFETKYLKPIKVNKFGEILNKKTLHAFLSYNFTGNNFCIVENLKNYFSDVHVDDIYFVNKYIKEPLDGIKQHPQAKELLNEKFKNELMEFFERNCKSKFFYGGSFYEYFKNREFIGMFMHTLHERLIGAVVEPGAAVGAVAGQSIGEPGTQMTLKTFHFAGVASMNITLGVPRLKEIINAAVNISTPLINCKLTTAGLEGAKVVKGRLERLFVRDVCSGVSLSIGSDTMGLSFQIDTELIKKMRLEIDIERIKNTILGQLRTASVETANSCIVYSTKSMKETSLFNLDKIKKQILNIKIAGLDSVARVVINKVTKKEDEYELIVEGNDSHKILGIPGIEPLNTTSNDIMDIYNMLGIEAARSMIIREVEYTMGKHGIKIDHRHVMLLADTMSFRGAVLGITRFGIGKMRSSTLMLASFEQTADYLFNAAVEGKDDYVSGVSESIIMGVPISLGTGNVNLFWDGNRA
ncbi:DNA-directed RNA polymerase III subunit RPC1 [Enteropsectra breve]|nr:DNA-directed RNA polymerase III subunit RPC1 [Enteropsectra breve]